MLGGQGGQKLVCGENAQRLIVSTTVVLVATGKGCGGLGDLFQLLESVSDLLFYM